MAKNETEHKGFEYPESHPKAAELKVLKARLNQNFGEMDAKRKEAREAYKTAGECTARITELLTDIAKDLKELESIAGEPLL